MKQRIFISGGAGVIGTALVNSLINQGHEILVGDLKPQPPEWKGRLTYRQGDLLTMTSKEIQQFNPEIFFHLAATFERSEETYAFMEENFHHNIHLSHHLLSLLKDLPSLKKILFASSYLIYDPALYLFSAPSGQTTPLSEKSHAAPRNLCGMAKWLHEQELWFVKKFHPHLQIIAARIFRSYGKNSRDIISRWIRMLLNGEPINVFRPEGKFDFIYADDVAEGLLRLSDSSFSGIVNLGTGVPRQISEVFKLLEHHLGPFSYTISDSDIPFEASHANMNAFYKITGWHGFRQLEETIPLLIAHEK